MFSASEAAPYEYHAGRSPQPKRPVQNQQLDSLVSDALIHIGKMKPRSKRISVCMRGPLMISMSRNSARSPLRLAISHLEEHEILHLEVEKLSHGVHTIEHWSDGHHPEVVGCMVPFDESHDILIRPFHRSSKTCRASNSTSSSVLVFAVPLSY